MCAQYERPGNKHWDITWKAAGIALFPLGLFIDSKLKSIGFLLSSHVIFDMFGHLLYITSGTNSVFFNTNMINALEIPTRKRVSSKPVYFICPSEALNSVTVGGPH